jgi:hypothetical protein
MKEPAAIADKTSGQANTRTTAGRQPQGPTRPIPCFRRAPLDHASSMRQCSAGTLSQSPSGKTDNSRY